VAEGVVTERSYGGQTMVESLRRVLVRRPPADTSDWERYGWRSQPDAARLAEEHERLCMLLEEEDAEVVVAEPTTLDAIYTFDPAIVGDAGAVLLRPGKDVRVEEVGAMEAELERAGVAVAGRLQSPALGEGGDTAWLDERTLLAGRGYRTNDAGIESMGEALGVETVSFDLPHFHGQGACMHLLSLFSPLDRDLVVCYPPLMPVRLVRLFEERGMRLVEVSDDEFDSMGPNVLALGPRRALALEHNRETRRRLEAAGVDVVVYTGEELSKGDGGPTCLTRPLLRAA
jgi:N-dimethylarginine dimethylaminohydrolase